MNYLEWNNALGRWFFNEQKSEQEVTLFISKYDIVNIGKEEGLGMDDEDIFLNFLETFKSGLYGRPSHGNILEHAIYTYIKWKENPIKIKGVVITYPLYIGYLTLFVLPLTENQHLNLRANAYYPHVREFLKKYGLPPLPNQNEVLNWNMLWQDLEEWSIIKRNTELGYFELHPFSNKNWIYVGKPLSQSIFPVHSLQKLPRLFEVSGLVPGEEIDALLFKKILITNGERYLGFSKRVIAALRNYDNELGQSIINFVKKKYQEWVGITDQYDIATNNIRKGTTIAQLRLCIEGDNARGYTTYCRLFTKLDYPEDLIFIYQGREYKCQQQVRGWSKPLFLPVTKDMEIEDHMNKWKAKFPKKDVRLLIEGKNFHLSGWVEVPNMISSKMLLLVKEEISLSIEEWGHSFSKGDFKKITSQGILEGHILYEICTPKRSHPNIPLLQFKPTRSIVMNGGIKIGIRTWLKDLPPEVELENGHGTETVFLVYEGVDEKIYLERKDTAQPIWQLPLDTKTDMGFYIKVEGFDAKGHVLKNILLDSNGEVDKLDETALPARDKYGQVTARDNNPAYVIGSRLLASNERNYQLRQSHYNQDFKPHTTFIEYLPLVEKELDACSNLLVDFLTVKGESSAKEYFEAFESVYQKRFLPDEIESHTLELSKLKRWSLNYLDYMGILDYEYSTKKIVVNPPQFILIPSTIGRKALLIGGRTAGYIQELKTEAEKEGLSIEIAPQHTSLSQFILPPTITFTGFNKSDGIEIENKLKNLAAKCSIIFDPDKFPQFRLVEFSGGISEYENQLKPDERFDDSGWPARIFDVDQLRFIPIETKNIDKSFSLVEYRLTEYSFKHKLWKNGRSYTINKNWGRYMVLNHYRREVIFNDRRKNIVVIPAALPLPRLISEAITLFSGKAPMREFMEIEGIKTGFIIYANLTHVMAYNTFLKVGQKMKETLIEYERPDRII